MKKPARPEPRPLKKAEVVRQRMRAQGELTRVSRARLPPPAVMLAELQAIVTTLQGAAECVFILNARGEHIIRSLGEGPFAMDKVAVVRCTFMLTPASVQKDFQAILADITRAQVRMLRDVTHAVNKTRLPVAMQKR
jgi:hypothetical protein